VITEERVMTLLARANPEPDEGFEVDSTAAAYLATLNERSSDMTQLKAKETETSARRPRRLPALAVAAVLVILVGVAIVLANTSGEEPPVATQPTPTTEPLAPSTTVLESRLADVPTWLGLGEAGTYQPSLFGLPFAFTLAGSGWETGVDSDNKFALCGPDVDGPVGARSACFRASAVAVFLLDQGSVEETQSYLTAVSGAEVTDEEPVSIDGAEGVRFEFTHSLNPRSNIEGGYDGYPYWLHEAQEIPFGADRSVVSIVDVNGTVVTVVYQGRAITQPSAFEANLEEGMAIIDSINWGD
jgi:hypothetical protein